MQEISRQQVQRLLIRKTACLVDVLTEQEFRDAHLPCAINVPFGEGFPARVKGALPDMNTPVIVYSADGGSGLSSRAAEQLDRLGYTKVFHYAAGKADWQSAGLRLDRMAATDPA